jgi:hypothetical protein
MQRRTFFGALAAAPLAAAPPAAEVLFGDRAVTLENVVVDQGLWIQTRDLPRANGFTLKPEGACVAEICIPVPRSMIRNGRFHLSAFARKIGQAEVFEPQAGAWSYGEIPVLRGREFARGIAPDFALPDRKGREIRLRDYRGRKVLLLTWASW